MSQRLLRIVPRDQIIRGQFGLLMSAALALPLVGCGGLPASVEGLVTLDGRPLQAARISFHPDAAGPIAYGVSLDDGSYRLKTGANQKGLVPGNYRVTVFATERSDPTKMEPGKPLTPPVYGEPAQTPLRAEVAKGANRIPLALESTATASGEKASR
jgi:hypothetical protein